MSFPRGAHTWRPETRDPMPSGRPREEKTTHRGALTAQQKSTQHLYKPTYLLRFLLFSASTLVSALLSLSGLGWAGLSNEASAEFHAVDRRIQLVLDSRPRMDNSCWEHRDDSSSPASRQCSAPFASRCEQVVVRVKRTESTERITICVACCFASQLL